MSDDIFENALNEIEKEPDKTQVEVYEVTKALIEKEIAALEHMFENDRKRFNSPTLNQLSEQFGLEKPEYPEIRGVTSADIVHVALLIYRLVFRLAPGSAIDAESLINIVAMLCRDDGIDFVMR